MLSKTPSDSLFQVRKFSSLISQTVCKSGVAVGLTVVRLPPQSEWGFCVDKLILELCLGMMTRECYVYVSRLGC